MTSMGDTVEAHKWLSLVVQTPVKELVVIKMKFCSCQHVALLVVAAETLWVVLTFDTVIDIQHNFDIIISQSCLQI